MEKASSYDQEIQQKLAIASLVTNGNQNAEIHQLDQAEANNNLSLGINGNQHSELAISIKEMVESSLDPSLSSNECCIYKIPICLRKLNDDAYTPQVISIGPFHHGNERLETMEKLKLKYFNKFMQRIDLQQINSKYVEMVNAIKTREKSVRSCYAETIKFNSDDFVKLILVDGIFIIEFFYTWIQAEQNDTLMERLLVQLPILTLEMVFMDLQLLENQLPFFILEELFSNACVPNWEYRSFTLLAIDIFDKINNKKLLQNHEVYEIKHFTDLARAYFLLSSRKLPPHGSNLSSADQLDNTSQLDKARVKFESSCKSLLNLSRRLTGLARAFFGLSSRKLPPHGRNTTSANHLYTANQLDEAGVKFKVSSSECLLDLKFTDGVFEIPCVHLINEVETSYRNVIAFEQCHYPFELHFTNYIMLLTFLITTPKDVDLLIRKGIIINGLGNSNAVASFLNNLGTNVYYDGIDTAHHNLFEKLNAFYENPKHIWKATLKRDYFSTPWRIASTAVAGILLLLTLGQFICSIIQVVKM